MKVVLSNVVSFFLILSAMAYGKIQMPSAEQLENDLKHAGLAEIDERSFFVEMCADKLLDENCFFEHIVVALTTTYNIGNGTCFERPADDFIYEKGEELINVLAHYFPDQQKSVLSEYFWYVQELVLVRESCR
jgi:hypothetical protein